MSKFHCFSFGKMIKSISLIFAFAFALQVVLAQNPVFQGKCPQVDPLKDFDLDGYMGIWYGIKKAPYPQVLNRKCIYAKYTKINEKQITLDGSGIDLTTGKPTFTHWDAAVLNKGVFAINYNNEPLTVPNYQVLDTDTSSYACVYNCRQVNDNEHTYEAYILSRGRTLSANLVSKCEAILATYGVPTTSYLEDYDQTDCPNVE